MKIKTLNKEERQAKKLARQQNRANITAILAALKGKEIKKLSDIAALCGRA